MMESQIFTYTLQIKEHHLDMFGHVNNATYLALFEQARWEIITANGYGMNVMLETGIGPTILAIHIQFLKEIRLREEITIKTKLISYEGKVAKLKQEMIRDGEICCNAELTIALFDLKERKIIKPTPAWLNAVGVITVE